MGLMKETRGGTQRVQLQRNGGTEDLAWSECVINPVEEERTVKRKGALEEGRVGG